MPDSFKDTFMQEIEETDLIRALAGLYKDRTNARSIDAVNELMDSPYDYDMATGSAVDKSEALNELFGTGVRTTPWEQFPLNPWDPTTDEWWNSEQPQQYIVAPQWEANPYRYAGYKEHAQGGDLFREQLEAKEPVVPYNYLSANSPFEAEAMAQQNLDPIEQQRAMLFALREQYGMEGSPFRGMMEQVHKNRAAELQSEFLPAGYETQRAEQEMIDRTLGNIDRLEEKTEGFLQRAMKALLGGDTPVESFRPTGDTGSMPGMMPVTGGLY